jgi:hypothetical protein
MDDDPAGPIPMEVDPELRQLLGLFDAPAFARRGQDLEYALGRLHARCRREREAMLEMVRVRLRQWAGVATGPGDWAPEFAAPVGPLWPLAVADAPAWAGRRGPARRRRAVARDLAASVGRFNRRWSRFLDELPLGPINDAIDRYNRYYLLEKECSLGSARLASRFFAPRPRVTPEALRVEYPPVPAPAVHL